ncbi:hypothetical protein [Clostridium psychrophilum]|uniref:hypothetical protein n=1 Tax=Clostridium psychrophilum TaxID=132926 RepID=UPI001C0B407F|nr:hypothetical protein [Clostridium psychrophilum]MBU3180111.1 hypothetical protein [Clostridium psychrophilum]
MIVEKNKFQMDGNTVLAAIEPLKKRRYDDLETSKKQIINNKKLKNDKRKKSILKSIGFGFVIGMVIIFRYCMIYNYQQENAKAKNAIDLLSKENDSYAVDLIKFSNIGYIEKTATTKLHMVKPKVSDIQYLDLSKSNLVTKEKPQVKINNGVVSKIKNIIF